MSDILFGWINYTILGITICGMYCLGFIAFNLLRHGSTTIRLIRKELAESGVVRLRTIAIFVRKALIVPAIFVLVGTMVSLFTYGQCATTSPQYCESRYDDFCLQHGACDDVQVWEAPGDIAIIHTLFNGFGKVVVGFQFFVVVPAIILVGLGVVGRYTVYPIARMAVKMIPTAVRKIPIRW